MIKKIFKTTWPILIVFFLILFHEPISALLAIAMNSENESLKQKINETKNDYYETEYRRLLETLDLYNDTSYDHIPARITMRDIYDFYDTITINKGFLDGVEKGMAVMSAEGLIGSVEATEKHSSIVNLLTNKKSQISIKIGTSYGILKVEKNGNIYGTNLTNYANILIGDKVYTSGLGNLPPNLLVGSISKVIKKKEVEQIIEITPSAKMQQLDYVAVIKGRANS